MIKRKITTKILSMVLVFAMCFSISACNKTEIVSAEIYTPGTYTASSKGFGGDVTVEVTVDGNKISKILVAGDKETENIGSKAIEELPNKMVEANSSEVDSITGATITSNAIKTAVNAALAEASGEEIINDESIMKDGTYNSTVKSYQGKGSTIDTLTVEVIVKDNAITEVSTPEFGDTEAIGGMAFDMLRETVKKDQSLDLDVISGATVSSQAFITALSECVEKAGGNVQALQAKKIEKRPAKTDSYETDILIIGAGITGLSAAVEAVAAENGANIILLEKQEVLGSSTTRSEGFIQAAGTDLQKQEGVEDTTEAFYNDIYSLYKDEAQLDENLLKKATDESDELIQFLLDNGVVFKHLEAISPNPPRDVPRNHAVLGHGGGITLPLYNSAIEKGVNIMMGTPATELLMDGKAVVGAKATNKYGDDITINAKYTILATGSYSADQELFKKINPLVQAEAISGASDGDGYIFAEKAGADMINLDYAQQMYFYTSKAFTKSPKVIPGHPVYPAKEIILLDGGGERVSNEDEFCFDYIQKVYQGGYIEGWSLIGKDFAERYPDVVECGEGTNLTSRDVPMLYKSDDIKDLAEQVNLDPEVLSATLERYNELCEKGVDEDFNKPAKYMEKINAPYYLLRLPTVVTDGYSGARINENSQVIGKDGNPIEGFYAAGSCAVAQMSSVRYYGCGTSILIGGVYGRAAAQHAVSQIN